MRLGTLDDAERSALDLVSVGEPVALRTIDALADRDCIERLEARALVDIVAEGKARQVHMGHPLYGEMLRAELPSGRYERICRLLADASRGRASCPPRTRCGWPCGGSRAVTPSTRSS
jgi:hypothetical protein